MIPANEGCFSMSKLDDNKAVVGRWFTEFWGKTVNLGVIDEIAAPDMLLKYSLHEPRRGRTDFKAFMTDFRAASQLLGHRGPDRRGRLCRRSMR
jgi:SnoaL-like polyketide cyclase